MLSSLICSTPILRQNRDDILNNLAKNFFAFAIAEVASRSRGPLQKQKPGPSGPGLEVLAVLYRYRIKKFCGASLFHDDPHFAFAINMLTWYGYNVLVIRVGFRKLNYSFFRTNTLEFNFPHCRDNLFLFFR